MEGAKMRVFVAGGTGAVGRRLIPQLVASGHSVVATTRTREKVHCLRALGAEAVVVDGLDGPAVGEAVARAEPAAVIHEMTALAGVQSLRRFDREFAVTNRLRREGTDHLLAAAVGAGVRRFVAQSYIGWNNIRAGGPTKTEEDPLDPKPPAAQQETMTAIRYLEQAVLGAPSIEGVVLRYGSLYGPGASDALVELVRKRSLPIVGDGGGISSFVHIDDAAAATVAALTRRAPGIYNVVDDDPAPVAEWLPMLAAAVGAKPPRRVPVWLGRLAAGEVGVSMMTRIRGASNGKAKREPGWEPRWPSWRDGFLDGLDEEESVSPLRAA
jgi:nucleoside-diphosphate-sugar epimerase